MRHHSVVLALAFMTAATLSSCTDSGSGAKPPAAPTALTAAVLSGGAHLTWTDNANDETQFMIMRKEMGSTAAYAAVATPTFNTTQYHDAPLTVGKTYLYMVMAMNDAGESDPSNEATIAIP